MDSQTAQRRFRQPLESKMNRAHIQIFIPVLVLVLGLAAGCGDGSGKSLPIVLNEVLAVSASSSDWIEIYNTSDQEVSLDGAQLRDAKASWTFPKGTTIPAKGFLQVMCDDSGVGLKTNFKLTSKGERLTLLDGAGAVLDEVIYPKLAADKTWGRLPDGAGDWGLMSKPTPGAANEKGS